MFALRLLECPLLTDRQISSTNAIDLHSKSCSSLRRPRQPCKSSELLQCKLRYISAMQTATTKIETSKQVAWNATQPLKAASLQRLLWSLDSVCTAATLLQGPCPGSRIQDLSTATPPSAAMNTHSWQSDAHPLVCWLHVCVHTTFSCRWPLQGAMMGELELVLQWIPAHTLGWS